MALDIDPIVKNMTPNLDEILCREAISNVFDTGVKDNPDIVFDGVGSVKVASRYLDGLGIYRRPGRVYAADNGYTGYNADGGRAGYPTGSTALKWEHLELQNELALALPVDRSDNDSVDGMQLANMGAQLVREQVIPEKDTLCFSKIASYANASFGNLVTETPTIVNDATGIIHKFVTGDTFLKENQVPETDQVILISPDMNAIISTTAELNKFVTQADFINPAGLTFKVSMFQNKPLIVVPSDRFYTNAAPSNNGAVALTGSKLINYIICSKSIVRNIVKLENFQIYDSKTTKIGYDGYEIDYHTFFDTLVTRNKRLGMYVSVSSADTSTKVRTLYVATVAGSATNTFLVSDYVSRPAGILGKIVFRAASAFTLGSTVTIDGTTIVEMDVGYTIATAAGATGYFALLDGRNVVVAASTITTLVKGA